MILIGSAWSGHTEQSRRDAQLIADVFTELKWKRDYAAEQMGLTEKELNAQLAGVRPLSHWRLLSLPGAFWEKYDAYRAAARGAVVLEPSTLDLIRGLAQGGLELAMAKHPGTRTIELPLGQREQAS